MRLAEALIQRADIQKRIQQLRNRLINSARIQEDEQPPENPKDLFVQLEQLVHEFDKVVAQINHTNSRTTFEGNRTLTDALAERDSIMMHRRIIEEVIQTATGTNHGYRYSQIKSFSTVDVPELQSTIDTLSRRYRELDTRIQATNWETDLLE